MFSCVCRRICLHLSLSISSGISWIISETETVSHVFYFQSLRAFESRHLSIDEEEGEPLACGWQKMYILCQVSAPDIMEPSVMIKVATQLRQDELSIFPPNPSSTNFST